MACDWTAVTNVVLSDNIINILFEVFDRDRVRARASIVHAHPQSRRFLIQSTVLGRRAAQDGTLNDAEFVFVVTRRHERNLRQPRDTGLPRLFHVAKDCLRVI